MKRNGLTLSEVLMSIAIVMTIIALILPSIVAYKDGLAKKIERQKNLDRLAASYRKTLIIVTERLIADETGPLTESEKRAFSERAHRFKDKDGQPYLATYETILAAFAKQDWTKAQKTQALCAEMGVLVKLTKQTKETSFEDVQIILDAKTAELELLFKITE